MTHNKFQFRFGIIALMIIVVAASRLLPHPYNFTPIGGMALFGAAYFSKKYWAFLLPLLAFWITDLILNNVFYTAYYEGFQWIGSLWVYGSMMVIVVLGMVLLKKVSIGRLGMASLSASIIFFLITNFGVWFSSPMYPKTIAGLNAAYIAGLPFFWNTVAGDLFYTTVLFGLFALVQKRHLKLAS